MRLEPLDPDYQIRPAAPKDLRWLTDLSTNTSFANGFTPRTAIADHIDRDDYTVLILRGQPAAFMFTSGGRRSPFRIVQSAVSNELWRQGYGAAIFRAVLLRAYTRTHSLPTCTVRDNLASNAFWQALGALHVDTTPGGRTRRRMLNHYAWTAAQAHHHAMIGASDHRIIIPEAHDVRAMIARLGFLPTPTGAPGTPTSHATHAGGIGIPLLPRQRRRAIAPPTDAHSSGMVRALDTENPAT